jgi:hypothetical protein
MTTPSAIRALSEALVLFGDISSSLVYITEELPSLQLPKVTEESVINFCCSFLECLVEGDKHVQHLVMALQSAPSSAPERAVETLEAVRANLWKNVQSMHKLVTELRARSEESRGLTSLGVLLNESGANILKDFVTLQGTLDGVVRDWKQPDCSPH